MNTFKSYLQSLGQSKRSVELYYRYLNYFINWAEEERIETEYATHNDIIAYISSLRKRQACAERGRSIQSSTVQHYLTAVGHYYSWQIKLEHREDNPVRSIEIKGIKKRSLYTILSKEELETLYHFEATTLAEKRNKVIVGLMVYQGLDSPALARLKVEDVKLREGKIYIRGSRRSNERTLELKSHQVLDLMEYTLKTRSEILDLSGKQSDQLFVSTGTSDHFRSIISKLMQKLRKSNNKVSSVNQIRSSVITHWLKQYNLREVQYRAGHRYVSSTEAYLVNDLEDLKEDITKYHPF